MMIKYSTILLSIFLFVCLLVPIDVLVNTGYVPTLMFAISLIYFIVFFHGIFVKKAIYNNIILMLMVWTIIIFIRGFLSEPNFNFFKIAFTSGYCFLPFTIPFITTYFRGISFLVFVKYITIINISFLLLIFLNLNAIFGRNDGVNTFFENAVHYLAFPNLLLIFLIFNVKNYHGFISLLTYIVSLVSSLYLARRGLTLTFLFSGFLFILFYLKNINKIQKSKTLFLGVVIAFLCVVMLLIMINFTIITGLFIDRIDVDSRSSVIEDFKRSMSLFDYLFGKGIGGTYFLYTTVLSNYESDYRGIVESGFYSSILYGGLVYFFLVLILYVKAIYNGFVGSSNLLAKAFSFFILIHLFEVFYAGVFFFDFRFLLIWIGVMFNLDQSFLLKTNESVFKVR